MSPFFASAHGAARSTYWLAADESAQVASSARCGAIASHCLAARRGTLRLARSELALERASASPSRHLAARELRAEAQRAREQVAEVLPEVGVVALDHRREIEVAVLPERDRAQQLVAQHVGARRRRAATLPNARAMPSGSTALRSDLLIFWPLNGEKAVREDRRRAAAAPALSRNAGQ